VLSGGVSGAHDGREDGPAAGSRLLPPRKGRSMAIAPGPPNDFDRARGGAYLPGMGSALRQEG
jgi:hypothetical protein